MVEAKLQVQRDEMDRAAQILRTSRDEATGKALSKLLTIQLERSQRALETATSLPTVHQLQGEIKAYRTMLRMQQDQTPLS